MAPYKWHPFLGLCGRVNQSRKKKFYNVLIAAIIWKHISSNSRLIATAKLPEICRQDCRSLEIWRIISVVGMYLIFFSSPSMRVLIGYFKITRHLALKHFPAKILCVLLHANVDHSQRFTLIHFYA